MSCYWVVGFVHNKLPAEDRTEGVHTWAGAYVNLGSSAAPPPVTRELGHKWTSAAAAAAGASAGVTAT